MGLFARQNKTPLGIYVHVPFCRSKCEYCDFYSVTEHESKLMDSYLQAVCTHIREAGMLAPEYVVDTVYFGGGTPSYFGADGMAQILSVIRKSFHVSLTAEITFEANPDSVSDKLLKRLRSEGFNRVSLGIQCDNDAICRRSADPTTTTRRWLRCSASARRASGIFRWISCTVCRGRRCWPGRRP